MLLRGFLSPALCRRRADLPRRRPRRPRDPALAAADLHARAHRRGDRACSTPCCRAPRNSCAGRADSARTPHAGAREPAAERLDVPGSCARRRARAGRRGSRPGAGDADRRLPARRLPVAARQHRRRAVVQPAAARRDPPRSLRVSRSLARTPAAQRLGDDRSTRTSRRRGRLPRAAGRRIGNLDQRRPRSRLRRPPPLGHAHSLEVWEGERSGRRHLRRPGRRRLLRRIDVPPRTDASKVALTDLVARLREAGAGLLEVQHATPHLRSLGAIEIPRNGLPRPARGTPRRRDPPAPEPPTSKSSNPWKYP